MASFRSHRETRNSSQLRSALTVAARGSPVMNPILAENFASADPRSKSLSPGQAVVR